MPGQMDEAADGPTVNRLSLAIGDVLVREGDAAGPMFVICTGSVRVYRRDLTRGDGVLELATLGAGDVIGELAAILGHLRSATVEVLEPTEVLQIPPNDIRAVMQQNQSLLRVVALALLERSDLSQEQIAQVVAKFGRALLDEVVPPSPVVPLVAGPDEPELEATNTFSLPIYDATLTYPKTVACPACGTRFGALMLHPRKDQPTGRDTDFHNTYRTPYNPYDYEVWVCPNDLYAALPAEFASLRELEKPLVAQVVDRVVEAWAVGRPDFNVDRTLDLRQRSLELALALYEMRRVPHLRLAAIAHRLAWCARERGDFAQEATWLAHALSRYQSGYAGADLEGVKEELRVEYLCGELSLRTGDTNRAITWFGQALRHPSLKEHPAWQRLLRERWSVTRTAAAAAAERMTHSVSA